LSNRLLVKGISELTHQYAIIGSDKHPNDSFVYNFSFEFFMSPL